MPYSCVAAKNTPSCSTRSASNQGRSAAVSTSYFALRTFSVKNDQSHAVDRRRVGRVIVVEVGLLGRGRCVAAAGGEPAQHGGDGLRGPGRLVRVHDGGVVREAEQRGALGAQPHDLEQQLAVVELAAVDAAGARGGHDPLPDVAVGQRREVRVPGRQHQGDEVRAVESAAVAASRAAEISPGVEAVQVGDVGEVRPRARWCR